MTQRSKATSVALVVALLLTGLLIAAGPSSAAKDKVYYLDYNGQAQKHPENVFFTANSGPRVLDINWRKWGKKRTVGNGTYYSNCNCPVEQEGPAKLILRKPVKCKPDFGTFKGKTIKVYRRGKMITTIDGETKTTRIATGYDVCR